MSSMISTHTNMRRPWVAVVLSLLCTGLGHAYCGQAVMGAILFCASLLFAPVALLAARLESSNAVLAYLLLSCLVAIGAYVFAVIDSYRIARRLRSQYSLRQYNRIIVYAVLIFLGTACPMGFESLLRAHTFEAFRFAGSSMAPNLLEGDMILVNKTLHHDRPPRRGDLVAFRAPDHPERVYIKRVIALPGDTVSIVSGRVYVNDTMLARRSVDDAARIEAWRRHESAIAFEQIDACKYVILPEPARQSLVDYPSTTIPEGRCFVLGDNRGSSRDSRQFGLVPLQDIIGGPQYIYFPAEDWSRFGEQMG